MYLNDPREMAIRPESGITLENDNRIEEMWHWRGMVLDLCNMPVEEYMKPGFIVDGGGSESGETPEAQGIIYYGSFVVPVSAFQEDNVIEYLDTVSINDSSIYKTVDANLCTGAGMNITVTIPTYEPFVGLPVVQYLLERKNYFAPLAYLFPVSVIDEYDVQMIDAVGIDQFPNYLRSKEAIDINGTQYYFYVHQTENLVPCNGPQDYEFKIVLTEK